jgi:hypothetical protein
MAGKQVGFDHIVDEGEVPALFSIPINC